MVSASGLQPEWVCPASMHTAVRCPARLPAGSALIKWCACNGGASVQSGRDRSHTRRGLKSETSTGAPALRWKGLWCYSRHPSVDARRDSPVAGLSRLSRFGRRSQPRSRRGCRRLPLLSASGPHPGQSIHQPSQFCSLEYDPRSKLATRRLEKSWLVKVSLEVHGMVSRCFDGDACASRINSSRLIGSTSDTPSFTQAA